MRILHYFLGFPPYRTGGLTKFAYDLMCSQAMQGDEVSALWPGRINRLSGPVSIKRSGNVGNVYSYELINPLPIPLDEGISTPALFMKAADKMIYKSFLDAINPDVIHVHTMMGIHEQFFAAAREKNIRIIYTTHDYYGLCTKVYMYNKGACKVNEQCDKCALCNQGGLSAGKIKLMQSPCYRLLKNSFLVKALRKKHRSDFFDENEKDFSVDEAYIEDYKKLRDFYKTLFGYIDCFHFTSSVAADVYRQYLPGIDGKIINITHKDIKDNRKRRKDTSDKIRLVYLAPAKPYKGYNVLKKALDELWEEGDRRFSLCLYCPVLESSPYMNVHEKGYRYDELQTIFDNADVLLAPSVWNETFGYTVLEAISYGVPVIISDSVGAKDVCGKACAVVEAGSLQSLKKAISDLDKDKIMQWNKELCDNVSIKLWDKFVEEMKALYNQN